MKTASALLGSLLFVAACAPASHETTTTPSGTTYVAPTPTLTAITSDSPTPAIGDTMHVFGSGFIDPKHGSLQLGFDGTYTDSNGNSSRVESSKSGLPLTYVGDGEATFVLGPDNVLGTSGTIGQLSGTFRVQNTLAVPATNGHREDTFISGSLAQSVTIGPSIFLDELRSADPQANCQGVTPSTTGSQNVRFAFHFVGMPDASTADPVYYTVSYDASQLTVAYVGNQQYGSWPFWGPTAPNAMGANVLQTGIYSFSDYATSSNGAVFDPQQYAQTVSVNPPVTINQQQVSMVKLAGFATNQVPVGQTTGVLFTIEAKHQSGPVIRRVVDWQVKSPLAMTKPTPMVLVSWEQAQLNEHTGIVKGSSPNGTDMNYNVSTSDSRTKTINMSWNVSNSQQLGASANLGAQIGIGVPGLNSSVNFGVSASASQTWTQTFGNDVSESDSITTMQASSYTTHVNPGMFGAMYVQWAEQHSDVTVTYNNACGGSLDIGTATLVSHFPYIAPETSTDSVPLCPVSPTDCHAAGPIAD